MTWKQVAFRVIMGGGALSLLLVVSSPAQAGYGSFVAARETALGLVRVDNLDGTFHYALPTGASTADQVGTVFTWRYLGQANFPWTPATSTPTTGSDAGPDQGDDPSAGLESVVGSQMVDELGRRWVAVDLNYVEANYAIADYWAEVQATYGLEPDPTGPTPVQDLDAPVSSATWNWTSWSIPDCNGDGTSNSDDGILLWDGEDRTTFNAASTSIPDEQKALMEVNTPAGICAGVRISEWLVLTAAHCVTDPVRNETFTGTQLQVCSNAGSGSCFPGGRVFVPSSWTGPVYSNHRHDYALVSIASSTAPSDPKMVLSSDTRNEVKKRTPKHVGWPGFFGNSSGSCDFIPPDAAQHPSAEVNGTKGGMLRLRADTSDGASGGPWYFVSGGVGRIVGVQSGFSRTSPWSGWVGGPRVHEFKNWVIATAGNR